MNARRRGFAVLSAVVLVVCVSMSGRTLGEQKGKDDKKDEAQRQDIQALINSVDNVVAGQTAPTAIGLSWDQHHFIKGQGGKTYVPYVVSIDPASLGSSALGMYVRLAGRGAAATPPSDDAKEKKDAKKKDSRPEYAFEDVHFLEVAQAPAGQRLMVSRAFIAPPGEYDVFVAAKERAPAEKGKSAPPAKIGVLKQTLTVPDFNAGELTTSTPILATAAEAISTPVGPEQQLDNPYTIGATRIVPSLDGKFSKGGELNAILWIYNAQLDEAKKPNVTVEFNFHHKTAEGEKFFNKTAPQNYNAQTLPPQFDIAAGMQLPGSVLGVPLKTFPEGQFRLEIKVTDNLSKKTITRDVTFTVVAA